MLTDHVGRQATSFADGWLKDVVGSVSESNSRKHQNSDYGSEDDSFAPSKKQSKMSYQASRGAPKLHKQMNDVLEKLVPSMAKADGAFDGALTAVKELPETTKNSDRALVAYIKTLQFHGQVYNMLKGVDSIAKLFGIHKEQHAEGQPAPVLWAVLLAHRSVPRQRALRHSRRLAHHSLRPRVVEMAVPPPDLLGLLLSPRWRHSV